MSVDVDLVSPERTGAELLRRRLEEHIAAASAMLAGPELDQAAEVAARIAASLHGGGKVLFFGNGGSSMDAGHLAAELLGRFYLERTPLPAMNLADCTAAMTAIGNDYSYDDVFSRQVQALGQPGDVAFGLTTSGNSRNVVKALAAARSLDMYTVALTGARGGLVRDVADVCIRVPSEDTPRVQELCMHLGHTVCELVEREFAAVPAARTELPRNGMVASLDEDAALA